MSDDASGAAQQGSFITFEGGEGTGKSTQVERLANRLRRTAKREVVTTREPGGTPQAEAIREAVLAGAVKPYGAFAEALMFCAARIDHLDNLIRPALDRGAIVLCDRVIDSTRAYQGAADGVEPGVLRALERVTIGPTRPDLTLILDLDPQVGLARARARAPRLAGEPDRFEAEAVTFHERLRAAFRVIAEAEPGRCTLIDASASADAVEAAIRDVVAARLPALGLAATEAGEDAA